MVEKGKRNHVCLCFHYKQDPTELSMKNKALNFTNPDVESSEIVNLLSGLSMDEGWVYLLYYKYIYHYYLE